MVGPVLTIAGVVVALGVLAKWGPLRWLLKQVVTDPVTEALDERITNRVVPLLDERLAPIHAQLVTNDGSSLRDAVNLVGAGVHALEQRAANLEDIAQSNHDRLADRVPDPRAPES